MTMSSIHESDYLANELGCSFILSTPNTQLISALHMDKLKDITNQNDIENQVNREIHEQIDDVHYILNTWIEKDPFFYEEMNDVSRYLSFMENETIGKRKRGRYDYISSTLSSPPSKKHSKTNLNSSTCSLIHQKTSFQSYSSSNKDDSISLPPRYLKAPHTSPYKKRIHSHTFGSSLFSTFSSFKFPKKRSMDQSISFSKSKINRNLKVQHKNHVNSIQSSTNENEVWKIESPPNSRTVSFSSQISPKYSEVSISSPKKKCLNSTSFGNFVRSFSFSSTPKSNSMMKTEMVLCSESSL